MNQNPYSDSISAVILDDRTLTSEYETLTKDIAKLKHDNYRVRMRMCHDVRDLMCLKEHMYYKYRMYEIHMTEMSAHVDRMSKRSVAALRADLTILRLLKRILMSKLFRFLNWFGKWYIVDKERDDILIPVNDRHNMSVNDRLWELERLY